MQSCPDPRQRAYDKTYVIISSCVYAPFYEERTLFTYLFSVSPFNDLIEFYNKYIVEYVHDTISSNNHVHAF